MDDLPPDRPGPAQLNWLASIVADGSATKEEARALLVEFVKQVDERTGVAPRLLEHLRDCITAYLAGERTILPSPDAGRNESIKVGIDSLDKALGIARVFKGRPPLDRDTRVTAAVELLELRLQGVAHQEALAAVADDRRARGLPITSETEVGAAWADYKRDALVWLRIYRTVDLGESAAGWTDGEMERLKSIYADVPGIVLPGEKPWQGRHAIPGRPGYPDHGESDAPE
jgi:hypothetical protein